MNSIDVQYNEMIAAEAAALRNSQPVGEAKWTGVHENETSGELYVKHHCPRCSRTMWTRKPGQNVQHCGRLEEMPNDLSDRLERMQIKKGLRRPRTIVDKLLDRPAAATPGLNAF